MQYFFNLFNSEKVENFIYEENKNINTNLNFFNVKFYFLFRIFLHSYYQFDC